MANDDVTWEDDDVTFTDDDVIWYDGVLSSAQNVSISSFIMMFFPEEMI